MDAKIYVVTCKTFDCPKDDMYQPIVAGACEYAQGEFPSEYLMDNTGENISQEHDGYSEYTVNYWVWKNAQADIVGINHYRRYFMRGGWGKYLSLALRFILKLNYERECYRAIVSSSDVEAIFKQGYNCILPKKYCRARMAMHEVCELKFGQTVLEDAESVIREIYPEYTDAMDKVMDSTDTYDRCICIMPKEMFDDYSVWFFTICAELEKRGLKPREREYAMWGERIMNVWVEHKRESGDLHVKEMFYMNTAFKNKSEFFGELFPPEFFARFMRLVYKKFPALLQKLFGNVLSSMEPRY